VSKKAKFLITVLIFYCFLVANQASAAPAVKPIYSMAVSGSVTMNEAGGYARIILTDTSGNEYLMYEGQGPFDSGSFSFENTCEETCVLNGVVPKQVSVELSGAEIYIDKLFMIEDKSSMNTQVQAMGMQTYSEALDPIQEDVKIDEMNQYIQSKGMEWTAGKTSISSLSYTKKKKVFGSTNALPNLEGFEYYTGGIFETSDTRNLPKSSSSNFPSNFDWRDRHGENWMTPVKNQGNCGSCWIFAPIGAIEAMTNLYFNDPDLNIILSEQYILSCATASTGCLENSTSPTLDHFYSDGIITQDCLLYDYISSDASDFSNLCNEKCINWNDKLVRSNATSPYINGTWRENLIIGGPFVILRTIPGGNHYIVIVGYNTNDNGDIEVIYKNSYGPDWGEEGYGRLLENDHSVFYSLSSNPVNIRTPITIPWNPGLGIQCTDNDNDNYCNWGISETKPSSCPSSCKSEKDCDDDNLNLGPFISSTNFNCSVINNQGDIITPSVGTITPNSAQINVEKTLTVSVSDNIKVAGCKLFIDGSDKGAMTLSSSPCQACAAYKNYTFTATKNYSAYAKCWDESGNTKNGSLINIIVSSSTTRPDYCSEFNTDSRETPPKCEQECEADGLCDEELPNAVYSSTNDICSACDSYCRSYFDPSTEKECLLSVCTVLGWDNSKCLSPGSTNWVPCDPTLGWKCFNKQEGDTSCLGQSIDEGGSNLIYGYVACEKGETAVEGQCKAKDNEAIESNESQIAMIPFPRILNNSVTFKPRSAWHCKFKSGLIFSAEGCGWAKCEKGEVAGINDIKKIELNIHTNFLNIFWPKVFSKTVSNQNTITWDGKNNKGEELSNGLYTYEVIITLSNGKEYRTKDKIRIQR